MPDSARLPLPRLAERPARPNDIAGRDVMLAKILAVALDVLDADQAAIYLHDPRRGELYTSHAEALGVRELRIDAASGAPGLAFRTARIVNIADAYHDLHFDRWLDAMTGYRTDTVLCAPIFGSDGACVGVVELLNKKHGTFSTPDERRLAGLASQMGVAVDYAGLFDEIMTIKSHNESMLRSLTNGVITVDLVGVVSYLNPAAGRILHLDADASIGRPLAEIFEDFNAWVIEAIGEATASGEEKSLPNSEFFIAAADDWIAANLAVIPLRDDTQHTALGAMLVIEDVQREKELRRTMSRYLSNDVIDRLMVRGDDGLGGSAHEVTILFSDIRGFTPLTERLGASETVSMLNEYFSFMEDVVTNRSGMIDKYIGDAIMALFGSPFPGPLDAANAVQAAGEMFQVLQILNTRRTAEGKGVIHIGVGIGTGTVITGNIGSPKRMDFTVIGDPVNLASRIEAATKLFGADILVCGTTWGRLTDPPRARRLAVVRLRGQTRPTDLWEVLGHRPDVSDAAIAGYTRGLDAYTAGRWTEAMQHFEAVLAERDDKPAKLMIDRCRRLVASAPVDWDSVLDLE
ncbi:MAG TPA: adenylate/guanylate cyclase domain-containing protein [Stellaceae bacterium]|jgi:adenylate cyclase